MLGVLSDKDREIVDFSILELYDSAIARLSKLGAIIKPLVLPKSLDDMRFGVARIIAVEGYYYHGDMYENPKNSMDQDVKARIMEGKNETSTIYVQALRQRLADRRSFTEAMGGMAAFLTPTLPIEAPIVTEIDQTTAPSQFTRMVNYLGFCALSVPMGLTGNGLPGGLHIISQGGQENITLRVGATYEHDYGRLGKPPGWG